MKIERKASPLSVYGWKGQVANFSSLPAAASHTGEFWIVLQNEGIPIISLKEKGLYYSDGATWTRMGEWSELFQDDLFEIWDNIDNTKRMKYQLSGITTGQTRTLSIPDNSGTIALKEETVPYSGATSDVNLGTYSAIADSIKFNTSPSITPVQGQLYWNDIDKTLDINVDIVNGVTMQIGHEMYIRAVNKTGVQINDGQVVYINGAQGNRPTIALAKADSATTCFLIGVATQNIADNAEGFITTYGVVHGYNTAGFVAGDRLYVSAVTSGAITNTNPSSPNFSCLVGYALDSTNNGHILISIYNPLSTNTSLTGNSDLYGITEKAAKGYIDAQILTISNQLAGKKVYHGIQSFGTPSFNNVTHVITIAAATNIYWFQGTKYQTSSAITCDLDSYVSLTTNTLYFIYFDDATGTLKASASAWAIDYNKVPVAIVYWNGSAGAVGYEYHNYSRDIDWHRNAHLTIGTRYQSGLTQTLPTTANDGALQIETGIIHDEDIVITLAQQTTARAWYMESAGVFTWFDISLPYTGTLNNPSYLDTDTYTLTAVGASNFACYWVYATNDISRPIYIIPSHLSTSHNTLALARAEQPPSLGSYPLNPEIKIIYKWIYKGDGEYQEGVDYRLTSPLPAGGTGSVSAASVSFTPYGNLTSTNVQTAIQELDDEKEPIVTKGNLTGATNQVTVTGGTGAVIGSGTSLALPQDIGTASNVKFAQVEAPTLIGSTVADQTLAIKTTTATSTTDRIDFYLNNTNKASIDNGGRLLLNYTTSRSYGDLTQPIMQLEGNSAATTSFAFVRNGNSSAGPYFLFGKTRSTTNGGLTTVNASDEVGTILFRGAQGTTFYDCARILASIDGTPGASSMPGKLQFRTTASGGTSATTRMTIDATGAVNIAGLTASQLVETDASKNLISSDPAKYNRAYQIVELNSFSQEATLNGNALYAQITMPKNFLTTSLVLNITSYTTGTLIDIRLYNSGGTSITTGSATPSAAGAFTINWAAAQTLTAGTIYWIGVAEASGSNTAFGAVSSVNNTNFNRTAATGTTAASLPAGSTTGTRLCMELI